MNNPRAEASLRAERLAVAADPSTTALRLRQSEKDRHMNFFARNLFALSYAHGFTLWHYKENIGGVADVAAAGFFDNTSDMFALGDMVLVSARDGGAVLFIVAVAPHVVVASMAGGKS